MKHTIIVAAAVAAVALAGCGSSGSSAPAKVTLRGTMSENGFCGRVIPPNMAGTAVVDVVSPSGAELAQVKVNQLTASQTAKCSIPFTVTGLPHERLYGVRVEGDTGTAWIKPGYSVTVNGTL